MFKGINEEYKKDFEKLNSRHDFYFYFADLELVEKNNYRRKCRLLSDELSQKLHSIYSSSHTGYVPPLKFIDFELDIYNSINTSFFPNENYHYGQLALDLSNHSWLLGWKKAGIQVSEVLPDGTLRINFKPKITCTAAFFGYKTFSLYEEGEFAERKGDETYSAYKSAFQDIENTIRNGSIDLTTLADSGLFLNESYMSSMPRDCLACGDIDPNTTPIVKYYETHLKKCIWRPDRINDFKDSQIALIERIITQFNDYKKEAIQEVIQEAQEQGISEAELNNIRPNWQNTLHSLTNREKIAEYFEDQIEKDIQNLVAVKNKSGSEHQQAENETKENAKKEEERLKKEREEREKKEAEERKQNGKKETEKKDKAAKEQARQQELKQKREKVIAEINSALNQEPQLTNSELSPQYQNWEAQINQLTDIQQITNFQDRILADISARRHDKKTAQKVKENLNKARTGTKEEKEQAWKDLEEQETEKGYQENKEEAEKLKKEKAAENPQEYSEEAKQKIEKKLKNNEVKEDELNDKDRQEWQKLKNGEIKDPKELVEIETKITQKIYQKGVEKKVADLTSRVNQVLKSKSKSQIAALKKELLEFISSSNIYYSAHKKEIENLLAKLESYSTVNSNQNTSENPPNFPWKIVIPVLLIGFLILAILLVRKRVKIKRRKTK